MLLLEFSDRVGGVAFQQRGVLPGQRFGQGGGGHELLDVVKRFGEGVGLGLVGPDLREVLVGGAPNQQGPRAAHARSQRLHHGGIVAGRRPPAVLEAITGVLVRPRRPLQYAVERQVLDRHDLAHFFGSSLYGYRRSCSYLLASVLWAKDLPTQGIIARRGSA